MQNNRQTELSELVSAVADGEANEFELRRILQNDQDFNALREDWKSYQVIGQVMRREGDWSEHSPSMDISSAVMAQLEQEAVPSAGRSWAGFKKIAVAASVAAVALIGAQQYQLAQNSELGAEQLVSSEDVDLLNNETGENSGSTFEVPTGFEITPTTRAVSSSKIEPNPQSSQQRVSVPFDKEQLSTHLDELVREHSANSANAAEGILPLVRVPAEATNEQ